MLLSCSFRVLDSAFLRILAIPFVLHPRLGRNEFQRVDRHEIIIMKIDAIGAESAQLFDDLDRTQTWPRRVTKRIAPAIAHSPESKSEFVFRFWLVISGHHDSPSSLNLFCAPHREFIDCDRVITAPLPQHGSWKVRFVR